MQCRVSRVEGLKRDSLPFNPGEKACNERGDVGYIPMTTVKADDRRRVQIPGIKAGQVFALEDQGNGVRILTELKKDVREAFPKGSLKYLCTPERDAEMTEIAKAFIVGIPKDAYPEE